MISHFLSPWRAGTNFKPTLPPRWQRWPSVGRPWRDYRQGLARPVNIGPALSQSRQGRSLFIPRFPKSRQGRQIFIPQSRQGRPILAPRFNGGFLGGAATSPVRDERIRPPSAHAPNRPEQTVWFARMTPIFFRPAGLDQFPMPTTHRWKRWASVGRPWRDYRQGLARPVNIGPALSQSRQGRSLFIPPFPSPGRDARY